MRGKKTLKIICMEGEGFLVEFKEKLSGNLDREIVAFANAAGGSIYLGINDDGHITGVDISNRIQSQIMDIARNCDPGISIKLVPYVKEKVLEIRVAEGEDKPYRCKDGFFLRIGPNAQKLKRNEIVTLINSSGKIHFDEAFNKNFSFPEDFSEDALNDFFSICGTQTDLDAQNILLNLNLAAKKKQRLLLTNAAILFFAKSPQKFFPESFITAIKYNTHDRFSIIDKKDFKGSPIDQIEHALSFVIRHISVEAKINIDAQSTSAARKDIYDYPPVALREAIVNAITHRDYYYDASHIYIHIFPDYIEIENPGGLHHGLTLENLGKRSIRRNRLIADLLHRAGYIERVGSGFDRMKRSLEENNNPPLEVSATNFFNIRFYQRLKDTVATTLTRRQLTIYYLFQSRKTLSKNDIAMALDISGDTAVRELKILTDLDLIDKIGVGKATTYTLKTK